MRKDDYSYFVENHDLLLKDYYNLYVVISHKNVVFSAKTIEEAIHWVDANNIPLDDYIIQYCSDGQSAYVSTQCMIFNYV